MNYRAEIDGLRAIAVTAVLLFHAGILPGGFVGVDVFFVISGYLIGAILNKELESSGSISFMYFYERRIRRIIPALFFMLLVSLPFAWFLLFPDQFKDYAQSLVATVLFSSNFLFWLESGYFEAPNEFKPLIHTWSLAVEEQYYFLFPPLLIFLNRFLRRSTFFVIILLALSSIAYAHIESFDDPSANFFLLPSRLWELLVGVLLVRMPRYKIYGDHPFVIKLLSLVGVCSILISMVKLDESVRHPGLVTVVPVLGTALLIACCSDLHKGIVYRLLTIKPMVFLGLLSYSLYLWHQPVFVFYKQIEGSDLSLSEVSMLMLLSLLFSYFSWRFVEKPFRDRSRFSSIKVWLGSFGLACLLFLVGVIGHLMEGYPDRFSPKVLSVLEIDNSYMFVGKDCIKNQCLFGAENKKPEVAVLGDSHARMLLMPLDKSLSDFGVGGRFFDTNIFIGDAPEFYSNSIALSDKAKVAISEIDRQEIKVVIVAGRYTMHLENSGFDNVEGGREGRPKPHSGDGENDSKRLSAAIKNQFQALLDKGITLVIVYPVPEVGFDVKNAVARSEVFYAENRLDLSYKQFKERNRRAYKLFDEIGDHQNVIRIYPEDVFCNVIDPDRCIVQLDSMPIYSDDNHLNAIGSEILGKEVSDKLKKVLLKLPVQ